MSVAYADHYRHWLLPSCGTRCRRDNHDPMHHELTGLLLALTALRMQPAPSVVRTGPLVVDLVQERAYVHRQAIRLSAREWGVLEYYARHAGRPCSHEDVLAGVWGPEAITGQTKARPAPYGSWRCDLQMLTVVLSRLRAKLGPASSLIETSERGKRRLRLVEPEGAA